MLKGMIEKIQEIAHANPLILNARQYTTKPVFPVDDPAPSPLVLSTLSGFVDYFQRAWPHDESVIDFNADNPPETPGIVLVKSHLEVQLLSALRGDFLKRHCYVAAHPPLTWKGAGNYLDVEQFIIALQSLFVEDENVAALLKLVGNLEDGEVRKFSDDGVTQQVTARTGIAKVGDVVVPRLVELAPFRTFTEVEQPKSKFLFRMQSVNGVPRCALFEADGGAWVREATKRVKDHLVENLPTDTIVLA